MTDFHDDARATERWIGELEEENRLLAVQVAGYEANARHSEQAGEHKLAAARRQCASDRAREIQHNLVAIDRLKVPALGRLERA